MCHQNQGLGLALVLAAGALLVRRLVVLLEEQLSGLLEQEKLEAELVGLVAVEQRVPGLVVAQEARQAAALEAIVVVELQLWVVTVPPAPKARTGASLPGPGGTR